MTDASDTKVGSMVTSVKAPVTLADRSFKGGSALEGPITEVRGAATARQTLCTEGCK